MHQWLVKYLAECYKGTTPAWMTKGKTVSIKKDKSKETIASNYKPITCLPLCWKILTALLTDEIYAFLENNQFLPEEQKGYRRKSRRTEDQLYIDKMILKEVKTRKKNLAMGWIDYQKAFDMLPHSWIIDCLYLLRLNKKLITFLQSTMKNWRVELTCKNENLGEVEIKRGIFQEDSLSSLMFVIALIPLTQILKATKHCYSFANKEKINHLLYMNDFKLYAKTEKKLDSLVQTVRVFSEDIGIKFSIKKCSMLVMKRGKKVKSDGIKLPEDTVIKALRDGEGYKYLGILKADDLQKKEMKIKVLNEYKKRVRKIVKTKLNGRNIVKGINTWAIPVLKYSAPFLSWTELQSIDEKTRKLLTMHNGLHPRSAIDRLYIPRKDGGRGLANAGDTVILAKISLEDHIKKSDKRLLCAARGDFENPVIATVKDMKKNIQDERIKK